MPKPLANSPADVVRQALVQAGYGNVFAGVIPPSPDVLIAVFNGTDVVDAHDMRGNLYIHYGVQLRVRDDSFDSGQTTANGLQAWMAQVGAGGPSTRLTVTGGARLGANVYSIFNFARIGPVLRLGMGVPNDKRFGFTVNALVVIQQQ